MKRCPFKPKQFTVFLHKIKIFTCFVYVPLIPCCTEFLRELNFADGRFFSVLREPIFAIGKNGFSCWELISALFRKSPYIWNYNILVFLSTNNRMQVNNMQMYRTLIS